MREILFRGKRVDNSEWIEGDLIQYDSGEMAILSQKLSKYGYEATELYKRSKVIPETVGQYTGIKDAYGKRIFVGDVVKYKKIEYEVTEFYGSYMLQRIDNEVIDYTDFPLCFYPYRSNEMEFVGCKNDYCVSFYELADNQQDFEGRLDCKIVGNIHDKEESK